MKKIKFMTLFFEKDYRIVAGINVNYQSSDGTTLLHEAANRGNDKLVKILMEAGANPSKKDNYGDTALDVAINNGMYRCIEFMLMHKEKQDFSAMTDNFEIVELLVEYRFNYQKIRDRLILKDASEDGWTLI